MISIFYREHTDLIFWSCVGFLVGFGLFVIAVFLLRGGFVESVPLVCSGTGFGAALGGVISLRHTLSNAREQGKRKLQQTYTKWGGFSVVMGTIIGFAVPDHLIGTGVILPLFIGVGVSIGAIYSKRMLRTV